MRSLTSVPSKAAPPSVSEAPITLPFPLAPAAAASSPEMSLLEDGPARSSRDEVGMAYLLSRHGAPPSSTDLSPQYLEEAAASTPGEAPDDAPGRLPVHLDVSWATESNFYAGLSGEVEGLFMATFVAKPVGTALVVHVALPGEPPLALLGRVAWVREFSPSIEGAPGVGIAFEGINEAQALALRRFARTRAPMFFEA